MGLVVLDLGPQGSQLIHRAGNSPGGPLGLNERLYSGREIEEPRRFPGRIDLKRSNCPQRPDVSLATGQRF